MKKIFFSIVMLFVIGVTQAQEQGVYEPLNRYIEGTTYGVRAKIKKAFATDAILYLTAKDGKPNHITPETYANYYSIEKQGKHTGRIGKILNVKQLNDVAYAEVQILIPKYDLDFTDLILLKRIEGTWKIISKTATSKKCTIEKCGYTDQELEMLYEKTSNCTIN